MTAWVHKNTRLILVLALIGLSQVTLMFINDLRIGPYTKPAILGGVKINLDIADSEDAKIRGLSDRSSLGQDQGMLFVYDQPSSSCMWMKDMLISLDVLWLNQKYEVVDIAENLHPDTYPESFCSEQPAQYFLEVPAGFVKAHGIQVGTQLHI